MQECLQRGKQESTSVKKKRKDRKHLSIVAMCHTGFEMNRRLSVRLSIKLMLSAPFLLSSDLFAALRLKIIQRTMPNVRHYALLVK